MKMEIDGMVNEVSVERGKPGVADVSIDFDLLTGWIGFDSPVGEAMGYIGKPVKVTLEIEEE